MIEKFTANRKFIFAMSTVVIVTGAFIHMHWEAGNYSAAIIGLAGSYLASQAYVDSKQSTQT